MYGNDGFNAGALAFGSPAWEEQGKENDAVVLKPDGGVRFWVYAPEAASVNIQIDKKDYPYPLVKNQDGCFSLTLYDIPGGVHTVKWFYDDMEKICPTAPVIFQENGACNYMDIPDASTEMFALQDVPHGSVRREFYYSSVTKQYRVCWVYTPPGYEEAEYNYPVLYALGGGEENETTWLWPGKINLLLDNLIAQKKCEEMLVVMNAVYVFDGKGQGDEALLDNFARLLKEDVIPFMERKYRVVSDKAHRAAAGNYLGASQVQWMAFHYPELFDYIGVFGGRILQSVPEQWGHYDPSSFFRKENAKEFNSQHQLLFYARGREEGAEIQEKEIEILQERGIRATFFSCEGKLSWNVARNSMLRFLPMLFKEDTNPDG